MSPRKVRGDAWIAAAAEALNRHGSWTGRIHIHKLLFVAKALDLAKPPFEFVLYDYGPYSFELDDQAIESEMMGEITRSYPRAGYGPRYAPTLRGREASAALRQRDRDAIGRVASQFGSRNSQELELIATCLWMERRERVTDDDALVARVMAVKPKYKEEGPAIRKALNDAREIAAALKSSEPVRG
jgi:uncharacterized protein YwgA